MFLAWVKDIRCFLHIGDFYEKFYEKSTRNFKGKCNKMEKI